MRKLWNQLMDAEPVVLFTALATLVPLITNGLVVFNAWSPTAEQLAYVNGFVLVASSGFGIRAARQHVEPWQTEPVDGG